MKKDETEVHYSLKNPFDYAIKGDMKEAKFVILRSPTVSNIANVARLKQGFMKAITSQGNKNSSEVDDTKNKENDLSDLTGDMIMVMLSMSAIDYAGYLETARSIFTDSDVCSIDGEIELSKTLIKKMSADDLESMTGEFLKYFILTSALRTMQT